MASDTKRQVAEILINGTVSSAVAIPEWARTAHLRIPNMDAGAITISSCETESGTYDPILKQDAAGNTDYTVAASGKDPRSTNITDAIEGLIGFIKFTSAASQTSAAVDLIVTFKR